MVKRYANAMFVLTSTMEFKQIAYVENRSTSFEKMEKLNEIYQQNSEFIKMALLEKFHHLSLELDKSIVMYVSKVETLDKQIKKAGESVSETAIVTKMLSSLPEKYRNVQQVWLSTVESKQTVQSFTTRILDEDASVTVSDERSSESVFTVQD
ncbi:hypothetical protein PR048_013126 [Dryococelus australis]|uniref:Uncharacterized protein n=1 Tax=Dryococelus australis TaxID=614101 RepID=A0ABQ9HRR4_9NEOP|nr:hypothetical protein PR048_013126 [Dryococelus australis]